MTRWISGLAVMAGLIGHAADGRAQALVSSWIQLGPGSSATALAAGSYGDLPLSETPTVLARTVVSDGVCPTVAYDHGAGAPMQRRFNAADRFSVPGSIAVTPGTYSLTALPLGKGSSTNAKPGYPQYFVNNTTPGTFNNGTAAATTAWTECEAVVPAGHASATIAGTSSVTLKLPVAQPKRILVMADTGCRLNGGLASNGSNQQNCHSPAAFPWKYMADYEATFKPDLILHVGDWFYRDTNCLTGGVETYAGCDTVTKPVAAGNIAYETWGDTFDSWNADVIYPAHNLLAAAPWIMIRGNHESCGRGARGWYALLDPFPYNPLAVACNPQQPPATTGATVNYTSDFEPSYIVNVGTAEAPSGGTGPLNVIAHDSSFANDTAVATATSENYDADLTNLLASVGPASMNLFATHKPSFGLSFNTSAVGCAATSGPGTDNAGDFTEQAVFAGGTFASSAFKNGVPANVGLFVSGHVHQFQYVNFNNPVVGLQFAPQLIVGTGGSLLDADCGATDYGTVPGSVTAAGGTTSTSHYRAGGVTDVAAFKQTQATTPNLSFTLNQVSSASSSAAASTVFSHDEFGFAVLDAQTDAGGAITGYLANIYKVSSAVAGQCKITLVPSRSISCNF